MADRKRPTKKKATTKKTKKTPKPDEKIKEKLKEKVRKSQCHPSISEHSLGRGRSGEMKQLKSHQSATDFIRKKSIDEVYKTKMYTKSQDLNLYDDDDVLKKRSSRKIRENLNSYDDDDDDDDVLKKRSSRKIRENLNSYDDDDDVLKKRSSRKIRENVSLYDDDDVLKKRSSRKIRENLSLHDDDVLKKRSSKKLKESTDDIVRKKSSIYKNNEDDEEDEEDYMEVDLLDCKDSKGLSYRQHEEYLDRKRSGKSIQNIEQYKKKYDEMDSRRDMVKTLRSKRSSRVSLAGIYVTREEGGEHINDDIQYVNKFDYVARADHSRTNLKLAIAAAEVCGVAFLTLMFAFGFSEDAATLYFQKDGEANGKLTHFAFASFWIFVMGNAMIIYRLFNQSKVKSIKYFHLTLHAIGFLFLCLSLHAYAVWWKYKDISDKKIFSLHAKLSILGMLFYFGQFAIGLCVYSLAIFRQGFRAKFYHYHSFFGFVVFFMAITSMCSGIIMEEKYKRLGYSRNQYSETWLPKVAGVAGVLFSGFILFIIIYPYFDFEKEAEVI